MALTKLLTDLDNVQALSDSPNETEGLTADLLKAKFDEAGNEIKAYINDTLTVEQDVVNATVAGFDTRVTNIEKYTTATATTNGDYKISSNITLTTGTILWLTFPAATSSTNMARLSIDDGTTYKNIKLLRGATSIPAHLIENKNARLKYDGTYFVWDDTSLVAFAEPTNGETSFTIGNLDVNADGGVYEIEAFIKNSGAVTSISCRPNSILTGYESIAIPLVATTATANGNLTLATQGIYRTNYNFCFIANASTNTDVIARAIAKISNGNFQWESKSFCIKSGEQAKNDYYVSHTNISNITSFYFDQATFATPTRIYIYKK